MSPDPAAPGIPHRSNLPTDSDHPWCPDVGTIQPARLMQHRRRAPRRFQLTRLPLGLNSPCYRRPILPRSLHLPRASTDGSRIKRNLNKTGVRLWTALLPRTAAAKEDPSQPTPVIVTQPHANSPWPSARRSTLIRKLPSIVDDELKDTSGSRWPLHDPTLHGFPDPQWSARRSR